MINKAFFPIQHIAKISIILKFMYLFEKATKFCEIFTLLLSYAVPVKSKVKISQNFVAFSEYMNFKHEQFVRNRIKKVDFIFNHLQ